MKWHWTISAFIVLVLSSSSCSQDRFTEEYYQCITEYHQGLRLFRDSVFSYEKRLLKEGILEKPHKGEYLKLLRELEKDPEGTDVLVDEFFARMEGDKFTEFKNLERLAQIGECFDSSEQKHLGNVSEGWEKVMVEENDMGFSSQRRILEQIPSDDLRNYEGYRYFFLNHMILLKDQVNKGIYYPKGKDENPYNRTIHWMDSIPEGTPIEEVKRSQPDFIVIDWEEPVDTSDRGISYEVENIRGSNDPLRMSNFLVFEDGKFKRRNYIK